MNCVAHSSGALCRGRGWGLGCGGKSSCRPRWPGVGEASTWEQARQGGFSEAGVMFLFRRGLPAPCACGPACQLAVVQAQWPEPGLWTQATPRSPGLRAQTDCRVKSHPLVSACYAPRGPEKGETRTATPSPPALPAQVEGLVPHTLQEQPWGASHQPWEVHLDRAESAAQGRGPDELPDDLSYVWGRDDGSCIQLVLPVRTRVSVVPLQLAAEGGHRREGIRLAAHAQIGQDFASETMPS